jgi:serine/threonine protein kinase
MAEKADRILGSILNGRYVIEKEIARSLLSVVYLARDHQLHAKPVAVKVLLEAPYQDARFKKKFRQEQEALTRIDHPGVVGLLDTQETPDGSAYIVMQYVEGVNLRSLITFGGMDLRRAANIMWQACQALNAAHEQGMLHRDLKPENIMIQSPGTREEFVKLIDFGIATVKDSQVAGNRAPLDEGSSIVYMAPEQLLGEPCMASDIYALGIIAYEMTTGRRPFNARTSVELYEMQRAGVRLKPRQLRLDLTHKVQKIILKALSFEAKERYGQASEFGEELIQALTAKAVHPKQVSGDSLPRTLTDQRPTTPPLYNNSVSCDPHPQPPLEMAYVLFLDIVGFSKLPMKQQTQMIRSLQQIVGDTTAFRQARARNELISLPTGDGMALAFFRHLVAPVRCALEISRALLHRPEIKLRMGMHSGPVYIDTDINDKENVTGGGINLAQRVMDCGDAGHILLSKVVADVLTQLGGWQDCLHDLGVVKVKHGEQVHIFNLYTDEIGNPDLPEKLRPIVPDQASPNIKQSQIEGPHRLAEPARNLYLGSHSAKLCDRSRQVNDFMDFFVSNISKRGGVPQVYFIRGEETECHDSLVERLIHTQIKPFAEHKWGEQKGVVTPKRMSWAYDGSLTGLQQELIRMLFMEFDPTYCGPDLSAKALSRVAASWKSALVAIQHRIYAKHWDELTERLIHWYLTYWGEVSNSFSEPQFLIFLNIIYPKDEATRWFKFWPASKKFDKSYIEDDLERIIDSGSQALPCLMLKELLPIQKEEVQDWLSRCNVHPEKARYKLLDRIFKTDDGRIINSKSMLDVEQELHQFVESLRDESIKARGML